MTGGSAFSQSPFLIIFARLFKKNLVLKHQFLVNHVRKFNGTPREIV